MKLKLRRCNFLDLVPVGIGAIAVHPRGQGLAVLRRNGDIECYEAKAGALHEVMVGYSFQCTVMRTLTGALPCDST